MDVAGLLKSMSVSDATSIQPVSGGWDTALWRVEAGSTTYALRVFPTGRDASCRFEAEVMRAAREGDLPVPRVHAQGALEGRPALLLDWCPGRTLLAELLAHPWRVWTLGHAFGKMQARIHQVKAPAVLHERRDAWLEWAGPGQHELISAIQALAPRQDALLHLDFHPLNVMTDGTRINAVIDWANALAGDPRADVARTYTILRVLPAEPGSPPLVMNLFRYLLARTWRRGYEQVAGRLVDLGLFYVWAGTVMVRDLAPKVGRPGIWLQQRHLDHVQSWTNHWRHRMGLAAGR